MDGYEKPSRLRCEGVAEGEYEAVVDDVDDDGDHEDVPAPPSLHVVPGSQISHLKPRQDSIFVLLFEVAE